MSPKDCAYIVERLAIRFMVLVADHERQLSEHRTSFGARTEADAKIIAGLRVQVQDMRAEMERLRAQMSEQEVSVVGIINERNETWERFWAEVARLKSQTPKHPVKVGEWVKASNGAVAQVLEVHKDWYLIARGHGWTFDNCEPCDPPIVKREPTIGDTVRLVKIPIMGAVSPELQKVLEWPWMERWGTLNQTALVVEPAYQLEGALSVCLSTNVHVRWPICCVEVVSEATHDTEAGKAAAEAALETESVAEEIKVGDVVEVFQKTGNCTFETDIGTRGTVLQLDDSCVDTAPLEGYPSPRGNHVALCDVRKVTT